MSQLLSDRVAVGILVGGDAVIATDTVAMLVLAGSVAAGYFVIAMVVAPRIRMPSASSRVVALIRGAAIVFFLACGLTHLHIVAHTLGLGGRLRPVDGHDLVIHLAQAAGAWLFIVGAALKLELHVVPAGRAARQRDLARAQLAEQQLATTALERRSAMAAALAQVSEQALSPRDLDDLVHQASAVAREVLRGCCDVTVADAVHAGEDFLVMGDTGGCDGSDAEFVRSLNNLLANAVRRRRLEETLRHRSLHDPLTGLANRSLFTEQLEHAWAQHRRHGRGVALIAIDLDDFKAVNDRHGHQVGDRVLVETAHRMRRCARDSDTLARLGGDEYAVILPETTLAEAERVAQRLHHALGVPLVLAGTKHRIAASVGIAVVAARQAAPDDLLREADMALYAAKSAGKARLAIYTPGLEAAARVALSVAPVEATAWADYMRELRLEIADRKLTGQIAAHSRAPANMHRTLEQILAAIGRLTAEATSASLALPSRNDLEEFVFHHTGVQHWADALVSQGALTVRRTPAADRFWAHLEHEVQTGGSGTPARERVTSG